MSGPLLTECHVGGLLWGDLWLSLTKVTYALGKPVRVWHAWLDDEHVLFCFHHWHKRVVSVESFAIILFDEFQQAVLRVVCIASQQSVPSRMISDSVFFQSRVADIACACQDFARVNDFDCKHRIERLLDLNVCQFFVGLKPLECCKSLTNFSILDLRVAQLFL